MSLLKLSTKILHLYQLLVWNCSIVLVIFRLAVCGVAKVKPHLGNEVGIQLKLVIRDGLFSLSEIEYHYQGAISGFLSDDEVNEIRRLKNGEVAL